MRGRPDTRRAATTLFWPFIINLRIAGSSSCAPQIHRRAHFCRARQRGAQDDIHGAARPDRRRDHLCVFGEAMTGGHEIVPFGQRTGNPGS